jgi:putative ABC transport system substrate-binding protein
VRRRDFITLLGGAVAGWPFTVRGQQPATPVVGFLNSTSPGLYTHLVVAFRSGPAKIAVEDIEALHGR